MADYRPLINRARISSTLDKEIYRELREYSSKSHIPITKILDMAISMYLDSVKEKK